MLPLRLNEETSSRRINGLETGDWERGERGYVVVVVDKRRL